MERGASVVIRKPSGPLRWAPLCGESEFKPATVFLLVILILVIAVGARFIHLGTAPSGLSRDEVSTGYDAYCIMKTGNDQFGEFLPLFARSYGDYNEALYRFLAVPSIYFLGLNEQSVRVPAALFGSLTVVLLFLLGRFIFGTNIALMQAFLLAISPWHVHFSKVAFRVILFPFFFSLALLVFLTALKKQKYLIPSAGLFVLASYTYSSARVFVPLFWIVIVVVFFDQLKGLRRFHFVGFMVVFVGGMLVLGYHWSSAPSMVRAMGQMESSSFAWIRSYGSFFGPSFLFMTSDRYFMSQMTGYGLLYPVEAISVVAGLVGILRAAVKDRNPHLMILVVGLLLFPIPAAFTVGGEQRRALIGTLFFPLLSGYGFFVVTGLVGNLKLRRLVRVALVVTLISMFLNFGTRYLTTYAGASWFHWDHGWKEVIDFAVDGSYDTVFISNRFITPHYFILFYTEYSPELYQKNPKDVIPGTQRIDSIELGKFRVGDLEEIPADGGSSVLLVVKPDEVQGVLTSHNSQIATIIKSPINYVPFVLLELIPLNPASVDSR